MTYETAVYYKLLLQSGLSDLYGKQIEQIFLEQHNLSGIELELFNSKGEAKRAISALQTFVNGKQIDYDAVCARLTEDINRKYESEEMSQATVVDVMRKAAEQTGKQEREPWYSMYRMGEYYRFALEGRYEKSLFDTVLTNFLSEHTTLHEAMDAYEAKKPTFRETIAQEKKELNRVRFVMNYIIVPVYIGLMILLMGGMGVLMSIDPVKFEPTAFVLMGLFGLATVVLLASVPYVRKKEIEIELSRYDFTLAPEHKKSVYEFVAEGQSVRFDASGVTLDVDFLSYENLTQELNTTNRLLRVHLGIMFYTKFSRTFEIPVCPDSITMLERFKIQLDNAEDFAYLLQNKKQAFLDIFKYAIVRPDLHKLR